MDRGTITFIASDPPMPPTGGGTRTFHFVKALSGIFDIHLFILFPVQKKDLPDSIIKGCNTIHCASTAFNLSTKAKSGILLKYLRLLFAPWSFAKNELLISASYFVSNPYSGSNNLKKIFFFLLRYVVTWYALFLYRIGYTIPAKSLERYKQYKEMEHALNKGIERSDILWMDFSSLFPFFPNLRKKHSSLKIFCNAHNIEYRLLERMENLAKDRLEKKWFKCQALVMKKAELKGFADCDLIITCSEHDRNEVLSNLPTAHVEVVPNGVDTDYFIPDSLLTPDPSLLFTGTIGYEPNRDAVEYFIEKILPYVIKTNPSCKFIIAGSNAMEVFRKYLNTKQIEIVSSPEDMRPVYNKAWIVVVPLRLGSGTRLKILEAMAMEKPVVSTTIGAEGIMVADKIQLFITDDDQDFAEKINLLIKDGSRTSNMVKAAKETILKFYSWESIRQKAIISILDANSIDKLGMNKKYQ